MNRPAISTLNFRLLLLLKGWVICLLFIFPCYGLGKVSFIDEEVLFSLQEVPSLEVSDTLTESAKPKEKTNIYIVEGTKTYNLVESPTVEITYLVTERVKEKEVTGLAVRHSEKEHRRKIEEGKNKESVPEVIIVSVPGCPGTCIGGGNHLKPINIPVRDSRLMGMVYGMIDFLSILEHSRKITEYVRPFGLSLEKSQNYFTRPPPGKEDFPLC